MKKIIIAPDSFKGSLSAAEVAQAIDRGVKKAIPDAQTILLPLADGGEGTVDTLLNALGGEKIFLQVHDPLLRLHQAYYALIPAQSPNDPPSAIIEMALASGLPLLSTHERNPLITSTYGTGELIRDALQRGCREIIITLGGSATNDAGVGMLQALGFKFLDKHQQEIGPGGEALSKIDTISFSELDSRLSEINIKAACDVDNPLYGDWGASFIFGPQKGADQVMVNLLDKNLRFFAQKSQDLFPDALAQAESPGAGSAGGLGFALQTYLKAKLTPGIDLVLDLVGFDQLFQDRTCTDQWLIITGEGQMDAQTQFGKVAFGVAQRALRHQILVVALVGSIGKGAEVLYEKGIQSIFSIIDRPMTLEKAMQNAPHLIENAAERIIRLWKLL
ncbi:MAG: glycerate kinase [Microscillaceae bacterium]|nr:glycerate kinase [Microscillaceae bacterium]